MAFLQVGDHFIDLTLAFHQKANMVHASAIIIITRVIRAGEEPKAVKDIRANAEHRWVIFQSLPAHKGEQVFVKPHMYWVDIDLNMSEPGVNHGSLLFN